MERGHPLGEAQAEYSRQIAKHAREEGFELARVEAASDNARSSAIILLPLFDALPEVEERLGPGVELAEGSKGFVSKNKGSAKLIWVGDDGRLRLLVERRFTSLERLLEEILKTRAERIGVSKEVAEALKKNGR